jgi:hypothetical protein
MREVSGQSRLRFETVALRISIENDEEPIFLEHEKVSISWSSLFLPRIALTANNRTRVGWQGQIVLLIKFYIYCQSPEESNLCGFNLEHHAYSESQLHHPRQAGWKAWKAARQHRMVGFAHAHHSDHPIGDIHNSPSLAVCLSKEKSALFYGQPIRSEFLKEHCIVIQV